MDWALYELRARNSHEGRRIFATSRGLIGTGPDLLKIGDQVCILYGAQIPFTLCPVTGSNDRYEVVGEAWVHGIMDGEFLENEPPGRNLRASVTAQTALYAGFPSSTSLQF